MNIQNGDIIAFRTRFQFKKLFKWSSLKAYVIQLFTGNTYEHVGVVFDDNKYAEAMRSGGVLVKNLQGKIERNLKRDKKIVIYSPIQSFNEPKLAQYLYKMQGRSYDILDALLSVNRALRKHIQQNGDGRIFCSELVARAYQEVGLFNFRSHNISNTPSCLIEGLVKNGVVISKGKINKWEDNNNPFFDGAIAVDNQSLLEDAGLDDNTIPPQNTIPTDIQEIADDTMSSDEPLV